MNKRLEAFLKFHSKNPEVYEEFKQRTDQMYNIKPVYSAYGIMHAVRFHFDLHTNSDDFKINNNHIPFYVRLILIEYPKLKGFFKLKAGRYVNQWSREDLIDNIITIKVADEA